MPIQHLLNLVTLADADVSTLALVRFEGREALSESFDYRLDIIGPSTIDVRLWIGKACVFTVTAKHAEERKFAGRIYEASRSVDGDQGRMQVRVRPAWHAASYARATDFIQDKTAKDVLEAATPDVPGLVTTFNLSPVPPVRGYAGRIDQSLGDFIGRLLAEDGITFFFRPDDAALYKHRMVLTNGTTAWFDCLTATIAYEPGNAISGLASIDESFRAQAANRRHSAFNVNKLDTPFEATGSAAPTWSHVITQPDETGGAEGVSAARATAFNDAADGATQRYAGTSDWPELAAGGRVQISGQPTGVPARLLMIAVDHLAVDPSSGGGGGQASYSNRFVAVDATKPYRPPVPARALAPGPVLGKIEADSGAAGEILVDTQSRVPVKIIGSHATTGHGRPFPEFVWLPVRQQWAHSTHGAQFLPRVGAHVVVDFLYGNPDLPFVSGCLYTPSQKYPFDPASLKTQSGWRSVTESNGSIKQEFHFEDKDGSEQIYLYTGRDYRRLIENDDWGTINRDQTLEVGRDQIETIKRDQTETVERDRKATVQGKEEITVQQTRTVKVTQKNLLESDQEIEIKVGSSSITLTPSGIVVKAMKIEIKADTMLDVSAGAKSSHKAPMAEVSADATLILKGGIVMIN